MKWSNIWELTKINILYSNPQILESIKKKREKKPKGEFSAYKTMIWQQVYMMLVMLLLYSYMFLGVNYKQMPGMFAIQLTMFMVISLIYGFTGFFAIFYDSNDTKLYLPLPLKVEEVYLAKFLSAQGSVLIYLTPIILLLGICYWQLTEHWLSLVLVLPMFVLLAIFVNLIGLILIHFIGEVLSKSPYKKTISTSLMIVSTVLAVALILFVQFSSQGQMMSENPTDMPNIYLIRGFYDVVADPFSPVANLNFGLFCVILVVLAYFVGKKVTPSYFKQILAMEHVKSSKKKRTAKDFKERSLKQTLNKHHLSTLADGTLIVQTYIMPLLYAFVFIGPMMNGYFSLADIDTAFFGIAFMIGTICGVFFANPNSFLGVAISLERDNYTFLKTLPFNFKRFIRDKFLLISLVQHGLPLLVYLIMAIFFKLPLVLSLAFLLGIILSAMLVGQCVFWRDKHLLTLNWQNVSQLFSRGSATLLIALGTFGVLIAGILLTILFVQLALATDVFLVNLLLVLAILILAAGLQILVYQRFWKKLND